MCNRTRWTFLAGTIIIGLITTASAQPVITPENTLLPLLGQDVSLSQFTASSPDDLAAILTQTGEGMTWDISNGVFGEADMLTPEYSEPPFTGLPGAGVEAYETANFVQIILGIIDEEFSEPVELVHYNRVEESQLLNLGFAAIVDADEDGTPEEVAVTFDPPEVEFVFPTTMGTEWTSETVQTFTIVDVGSFEGGTVTTTNEVVGWGTLVTPAGSAEVLQIDQELVISSFGIVSFESRNTQFIGPLQEVTGKGALQHISANVVMDLTGSVTEEVFYTVVEVGGEFPTATEDLADVPSRIQLEPNYPNPFNPSTTIPFSVDRTEHVVMTVHDVLGRQLDVIVDRVLTAGDHTVRWDATALPSGPYHVRLSSNGQVRSRTMLLNK